MALIDCPECNRQVSDQASQCIYCGYPLGETLTRLGRSPRRNHNLSSIYQLILHWHARNVSRPIRCKKLALSFSSERASVPERFGHHMVRARLGPLPKRLCDRVFVPGRAETGPAHGSAVRTNAAVAEGPLAVEKSRFIRLSGSGRGWAERGIHWLGEKPQFDTSRLRSTYKRWAAFEWASRRAKPRPISSGAVGP